jgi:hypothetical protein
MPMPFVECGRTVSYGWQTVDQAALALVDTGPLFLVPGRRCENRKPVPVDRPAWKQFTAALMDVGRAAYRASQTRNVDAVVKIAEQLNDSCAIATRSIATENERATRPVPAGANESRHVSWWLPSARAIGRPHSRQCASLMLLVWNWLCSFKASLLSSSH